MSESLPVEEESIRCPIEAADCCQQCGGLAKRQQARYIGELQLFDRHARFDRPAFSDVPYHDAGDAMTAVRRKGSVRTGDEVQVDVGSLTGHT